jgi:DNA-binding NtrC family response regulator
VPMATITQNLPRLADPDQELERRRIIEALVHCNGNQTQAARHIGMPRRTFVSKLDFYGIPRPMKGRRTDDAASTMTMMKAAGTNDGSGR